MIAGSIFFHIKDGNLDLHVSRFGDPALDLFTTFIFAYKHISKLLYTCQESKFSVFSFFFYPCNKSKREKKGKDINFGNFRHFSIAYPVD